MSRARVKINRKAVDRLCNDVLRTDGVRRMQRVKDAANSSLLHESEGSAGQSDDYRLSVEGSNRLRRNDMVTVITATASAMEDNTRNNTLVNSFHQAAGG